MELFSLAIETTERYIQNTRVTIKDAQRQIAALRKAARTDEEKYKVKALETTLAQRQKK